MHFNRSRIIQKIKAIISIIKAKGISKTIKILPSNEMKVVIENILKKHFKVQTLQHDILAKSISDEIFAKISSPTSKVTSESLEGLLDGVLSVAFWNHSQLAALTTIWEFRIRLLGVKLGISPYQSSERKSKKNRANNSIEHIKLSDTIREIEKKTGSRLTLRLMDLNNLRDVIIHCNSHGIRKYSEALFGKNKLADVRGNVLVVHLNTNTHTNLSSVESEPEKHDVFSWFLEMFNSKLPELIFNRFEESVKSLDTLIDFSAASFENRKQIWERLFFEGKCLSSADISAYQKYFESSANSMKRNTDEYFKVVLNSFKNLNEKNIRNI